MCHWLRQCPAEHWRSQWHTIRNVTSHSKHRTALIPFGASSRCREQGPEACAYRLTSDQATTRKRIGPTGIPMHAFIGDGDRITDDRQHVDRSRADVRATTTALQHTRPGRQRQEDQADVAEMLSRALSRMIHKSVGWVKQAVSTVGLRSL